MLTLGQQLWYVPSDSREVGRSRFVTVLKVGRRWADIDGNERVDLESLWADGGKYCSPGRCWLSKEAWDDEQERLSLWHNFQQRISHRPPDGMTIETIRQIAKMLLPPSKNEPSLPPDGAER